MGGFSEAEVVTGVELPGGSQGPLAQLQQWVEKLRGGGTDPFFAVVARRLDDGGAGFVADSLID